MSLAVESPLHSDDDDFAELVAELDAISSDSSPEVSDSKEDGKEDDFEEPRKKRRKLEGLGRTREFHESIVVGEIREETGASTRVGSAVRQTIEICSHPGFIKKLCIKCGHYQEDDGSAIAFGYIHKDLKLDTKEIDRLRGADLKNLLRNKKLILILDLDLTLLNSTMLVDITPEEKYLLRHAELTQDDKNRSLFKLEHIHMLTKLRPFVHKFLEEASSMFEMYLYTMARRSYALEIAKLLDPQKIYFDSKVISESESTLRNQKGLDVVAGAETAIVILDDTEGVWSNHKENLILMERYHYFASSCREYRSKAKPLSESMKDERESDGALADTLILLKRVHQMFFSPDLDEDISARDVRQVLKKVRGEVLQGCKLSSSYQPGVENRVRTQDSTILEDGRRSGATCAA